MAIHAMVDIETLDTKYSATILTVGAVRFDPFSNSPMEEFYFRVETDGQEALGMTISDDTLAWWAKQSPEVQNEAFTPYDRFPLSAVVECLNKFVWGCDKVWAHGPHFDIPILEFACEKSGITPGWNFWDIRDTRTIFDLADPEMPQNAKHNALEDVKRQAIGVRNVYRKIKFSGTKLG